MALLYSIFVAKKSIPKQVLKSISSIEISGNSYAAFDMDNTLLVGDIGEALLALLIKKKLIENFGWSDYLQLVEKNKLRAYQHTIDIMQGLKISQLKKVTLEVIGYKKRSIILKGYKIPVPKPNLLMKEILAILKKRGIPIYIVTASNEVSAQIICKKYFGIPGSSIMGAEVTSTPKGIIKKSSGEFPYGKGKVTILKKRFKNKPLITAGDSPGDKYLLRYTAKNGICFWLGKDAYPYETPSQC